MRLQSATIKEFGTKKKRGAKKKKLNHEEIEQTSLILKMPVEIVEYIFDYLKLDDLRAISATCKRMQQLATWTYKKIHPGLIPFFTGSSNKRYPDIKICRYEYGNDVDMENFIPFLEKITIFKTGFEKNVLYKFIDRQSEFQHLKQLTITDVGLTDVKIQRMQKVLNNLEYLCLEFCRFDESVIENLLSNMPNIKRFSVHSCKIIIGNTWFGRRYPTLQHCEIISKFTLSIATFLTLNPNIRKFGINVRNLWENRYSIENSQLEDLAIKFEWCDQVGESFWHLLNEYHQLGVYKRLCFFFDSGPKFNQEMVDGLASLNTIYRLYVEKYPSYSTVALSGLVHLEDISFPDTRYIIDIDTVATRLNNLKFIHFRISNLTHVKLFIGRNPKLERIRIDWFMDEAGNIKDEKCLNLIELNKERAKIPNAKKVTLYVEESTYLATKRATRDTDFDFINLKRTNTLNGREFDFEDPMIYTGRSLYPLR